MSDDTTRPATGEHLDIEIVTTPDSPADRITAYCDALETAPWVVQDDVPLDDVRDWIAGIRRDAEALAEERDALAAQIRRLQAHAIWLERQVLRGRGFREDHRRVSAYFDQTYRRERELIRKGLQPGDLPAEEARR